MIAMRPAQAHGRRAADLGDLPAHVLACGRGGPPWLLPIWGIAMWLALLGTAALASVARLHPLLSDSRALGGKQRDAGHAADPGDHDPAGYLAWASRSKRVR